MIILLVCVVPAVSALSIGSGITPDITTEQFAPKVWLCDNRVMIDDNTEPWRTSPGGAPLVERFHNYAFEGEKISWIVLVMDKNKIDQNIDVFATVSSGINGSGTGQGAGNPIEANCKRIDGFNQQTFNKCSAQIQEETVVWNPELMSFFECQLTIEPAVVMHGEHWITVEAKDGSGLSGTMHQNEFWFLNPDVALSIDGNMKFDNVRPGAKAYSQTILVGNDADAGSGVMLDMFISGTDFYDSSSSGARCPTTNQLSLSNFRYYATSGAYSTQDDPRHDTEGYVGIKYGTGFNDPNPFYNNNEIIQAGGPVISGVGYKANVLSPGAEMALTFKLSMPEPCNGNFDTGQIFFWGEAV